MNVAPAIRRTATVALAVLVAGAAVLTSASAASAAPAPPPGVYGGNHCVDAHVSAATVGSEGCVFVNGRSASSVWFSLGAADNARDGRSSRTDVWIQQGIPGTGWVNNATVPTVIDSSGYGTTRVGNQLVVNRRAGAVSFRFVVRSCTFDAPTGRYFACSTQSSYGWAW